MQSFISMLVSTCTPPVPWQAGPLLVLALRCPSSPSSASSLASSCSRSLVPKLLSNQPAPDHNSIQAALFVKSHLENICLGCLSGHPVLHSQPASLRQGHPESNCCSKILPSFYQIFRHCYQPASEFLIRGNLI